MTLDEMPDPASGRSSRPQLLLATAGSATPSWSTRSAPADRSGDNRGPSPDPGPRARLVHLWVGLSVGRARLEIELMFALTKGSVMADPRAFVSFDFDHDETSKNLFCGQGKGDSPTPFTVEDWSSKSSLPQSEWEEILQDKINRCNMLIVLVGRCMASAAGVAKEIQMAKDQDVPVFGVYVDGSDTSSNLPTGLARGRVVTWNWDDVASAIDQCMTEGKNRS